MKQSDLAWCRRLFDSIKDGGVWGLPACGLVFRKTGDALVLVECMPHTDDMPMTAAELKQYQEREYENNRRHFEAAGVNMRRKSDDDGKEALV